MENVKKRIILSCETLETRFALLNNDKLEEYEIERESNVAKAGSVYLGKIVNLEASLHAAFVDIGAGKNAFLHYWDMLPATFDMQDKLPEDEKGKEQNIKKKKTPFAEKVNSFLSKDNKSKQIREKKTKRQVQQYTVKDISGGAGEVLQADKKALLIACAKGALEILKLVPQGKKEMSGPAFLNGHRLSVGTKI